MEVDPILEVFKMGHFLTSDGHKRFLNKDLLSTLNNMRLILPTPAIILVAVFLSGATANPLPAAVSDIPTAIADPVAPTGLTTSDSTDPAVKTACQKGCNQGYRSCLAHTPRFSFYCPF
jgi:hypothetical protein